MNIKLKFYLALALLLPGTGVQASRPWMGQVTHVSDGDTVWVKPAGNAQARKIRILGIDAPETCQEWGPEAKALLTQWLWRASVVVRPTRKDSYGRLLATLYWNQQDVGERLVASGAAWSYQFRRNRGPYERQETEARRSGRGLFGNTTAIRPRDFRVRHGPCDHGGADPERRVPQFR